MRLPLVLFLVMASAMASAIGIFYGLQMKPELLGLPPGRVAPAKADPPLPLPVATAVTALGRLEPETEIVGIAAAPGNRIETLHVKEHDHIDAGALIATLDTHEELAAARAHAHEMVGETERRAAAESAHAQTGIDVARLKLKEADEVLQRGVEAQEAAVRRCEAELAKARKDLGRSTQMLGDHAIPQSQFDTAQLATRQFEEQLAQLKASLVELKDARAVKIAQAQAGVKAAETDLERVKRAFPLDSLKAAEKLAAARLERTLVKAPFAGEVLKIFTHAGETTGASPILRMGDTAHMFAIAEVYETDAHRVSAGQSVNVTSKAFPPGLKLEGKVESISALVHKKDVLSIDPAADADARVLEARIRLADSALAARFNYLQVDVTIDVGK